METILNVLLCIIIIIIILIILVLTIDWIYNLIRGQYYTSKLKVVEGINEVGIKVLHYTNNYMIDGNEIILKDYDSYEIVVLTNFRFIKL